MNRLKHPLEYPDMVLTASAAAPVGRISAPEVSGITVDGKISADEYNGAAKITLDGKNLKWLPWISHSFVDPIIDMRDRYGNADVTALADRYSREELSRLRNSGT